MRTFEPMNAGRALEGGWARWVLSETALPWAVPLLPWTHAKGAERPQAFLAHLVDARGIQAGKLFWFHPVLDLAQTKGDLVHGDLVEWRGKARMRPVAEGLEAAGLVSSLGLVWRWPEPFRVRPFEELAVLVEWR